MQEILFLNNFSIDVIGEQIDKFIESQPKVDYEFTDAEIERDPLFDPDMDLDDLIFVLSLYENILKRTEDENDEGVQH